MREERVFLYVVRSWWRIGRREGSFESFDGGGDLGAVE